MEKKYDDILEAIARKTADIIKSMMDSGERIESDTLLPKIAAGIDLKNLTEETEPEPVNAEERPEWEQEAKAAFEQMRMVYLDLVEKLQAGLSEKYSGQLVRIEQQVASINHFDDFAPVHQELAWLLNEVFSRMRTEREQAAEFISEVGETLVELEDHARDSISYSRESYLLTIEFTDSLSRQLQGFRETVDFSKNLPDLKQAVVSTIENVRGAVAIKRLEEAGRAEKAEKSLHVLKKSLDRLQIEVEDARKKAEKLERDVLIDPLTGAYNRRAYDNRIVEELSRFHRYGQKLTLMLIDVDHFKQINDNYGHIAGDVCLKEIVSLSRSILRESDFLVRYGGEEFVLLFPGTSVSGAGEVGERLRCLVENHKFEYNNKPIRMTVSIGLTEASDDDTAPDQIFKRLDQAMYKAKRGGRNRIEVSDTFPDECHGGKHV